MQIPGFVSGVYDRSCGLFEVGVAKLTVVEEHGSASELVGAEFAFVLTNLKVFQAKALFAAIPANAIGGIFDGRAGFRVTVGRKMLRVT